MTGRFFQSILTGIIRSYQRFISPLFPGCCRYQPTCSAYAIEAINIHGPVKGLLLAAWRILRCNPFSKGGYDPVPQKGRWSWKPKKKPDDRA